MDNLRIAAQNLQAKDLEIFDYFNEDRFVTTLLKPYKTDLSFCVSIHLHILICLEIPS